MASEYLQWMRVVLLLAAAKQATSIPLADFYPFGLSAEDTLLPITDDGSSGIVTLRKIFPFYRRDHFTIVVCLDILY